MPIRPEEQFRLILNIITLTLLGQLINKHLRQTFRIHINIDDKIILILDMSDIFQILTMQLD